MTPGERRNLRLGMAFTGLWVVGFGLFLAYPVAASLFYSFCDYSILQKPVWTGLENYRQLWQDDVFWRSLRNTLFFAGFSVPLGTLVSLSMALLLNIETRGRAFFRTIFYLPSIVPVVASSMLWLWIFNGQFGVLNWLLRPLFAIWGGMPPAWLGDPAWAKPALVMMSLWGVGNSMVIYLAGLQDVPKELYESASIDGANVWRRLWHVTLPMISPVIYFNVIMGIIGSLQVFGVPYIMFGNGAGPNRSAMFYATYIFENAFRYNQMGYASAMAWILFLIILALTWVATKASRRHIYYAGE